MKSVFKKLVWLEFRTTLGPFAVWGVVSALFCGCVVLRALEWMGPVIVCARLLWLGASLGVFVAFVNALVEKRFGTAILQFFLGLLCLFGFAICFVFANMASWSTAHRISTGPTGWAVSEMTERIPFSVEYKPAHPFLAEYDKRIAFKSGKRIGVWMDTGGGGPFAVYALGTGEYYLADGVTCDFMRNDYRVNVSNETVEINVDGVWLRIPDGTVTVNGRGSGSLSVKFESGEKKHVMITNGVPLGKTLECRRFLGYIRPNGKFEACSNDPFVGEEGRRRMGHETDWTPRGLTDKLPFEIEDGKRQRYCSRRFRLKSGKTLEIVHESFSPEPCGIYRLGSDEYNIVSNIEKDECWQRSYRVNVSNETIDVEWDGHWLRLPEGALSVGAMGRGEKDGLTTWHVTVQTANGSVEGHEASPAGDYKKSRQFVGKLTKDGLWYNTEK